MRFALRLEHMATVPGLAPLAGLTRSVTTMDTPEAPPAQPDAEFAAAVAVIAADALLFHARMHRNLKGNPLIGGALGLMAANLVVLSEHQLASLSRLLEPIPAALDATLAVTVGDLMHALGDPAQPWDAERALDIAQCMERVQRALAGRPS